MRKKLLSILLVLSLMLALVPAAFAADIASGTCGAEGDGSNVTWTLDETGLLTISGTGKIASGTGGSIWSDKPVLAVDIRSGVTGVGKDAFYGCDDLQVISLPDTVTQLDDNALGNCPALSDILVDAKTPPISPWTARSTARTAPCSSRARPMRKPSSFRTAWRRSATMPSSARST